LTKATSVRRREFLGGLVAAGAAPLGAHAQATAGPRIDLHHHFLPQEWIAEARSHKPDGTWPDTIVNWRPQVSIDAMDRYGVATALVELGLPGVWWAPPPLARRLARMTNEYAAEMARTYPGRFGFFATIPLPDVEGTLAEIAYAYDVLHADGIGLLTDYGDKWPGDRAFAAVFDELNRRKAVVHVHPTVPDCCTTLIPGVLAATEEYVFDTARAITSLLYSHTFTRCPNISFIFSHAGGAFPSIAPRVVRSLVDNPVRRATFTGGDPNAELHRLYFDVASSANTPTFQALRAFTSTQQIVLGTDLPYLPMSATIPNLDAIKLSAADANAINTGNARRLFPRLK
jgi:predicted TIM-barrel fold metal-dependent hydrolase